MLTVTIYDNLKNEYHKGNFDTEQEAVAFYSEKLNCSPYEVAIVSIEVAK